jgi:hypothetical protein
MKLAESFARTGFPHFMNSTAGRIARIGPEIVLSWCGLRREDTYRQRRSVASPAA